MTTTNTNLDRYELDIIDDTEEFELYSGGVESILGDFADDYDVAAIEDALTFIDYETGHRYWKNVSEDELNAILAANEIAAVQL